MEKKKEKKKVFQKKKKEFSEFKPRAVTNPFNHCIGFF